MSKIATIITTTLLAFASADVSNRELYQRGLKHIYVQKATHFSRGLSDEECVAAQTLLDETGINELADETVTESCEFIIDEESIEMECDFSDIAMDSDACSDVGGRVISLDLEFSCVGLVMHFHNLPTCLHTSCDEDMFTANDVLPDDDAFEGCEMDVDVSGAHQVNSKAKAVAIVASLFSTLVYF